MKLANKKAINKTKQVLTMVLITLIVIFNCFPIYWMILTSFRPETEIVSKVPKLLPDDNITFRNYRNVFSGYCGDVKITESAFVFIWNSLIVGITTTFLTLVLCSPAAYAISRIQFRGREAASSFALICYLVPPLALIVPVFVLCVKTGLNNSLLGMILVETIFNIPVCMWLLRGYFVKLPVEVEEAAVVDGCRRLQVITRIMLPMALPGLTVASVVCFLNAWNSYLFPLILLKSDPLKTAPVGLSIYLNEQIGMVWGEMMAAGAIIAVPVIIVFLLIQRNLVGGITAGAVKS